MFDFPRMSEHFASLSVAFCESLLARLRGSVRRTAVQGCPLPSFFLDEKWHDFCGPDPEDRFLGEGFDL